MQLDVCGLCVFYCSITCSVWMCWLFSCNVCWQSRFEYFPRLLMQQCAFVASTVCDLCPVGLSWFELRRICVLWSDGGRVCVCVCTSCCPWLFEGPTEAPLSTPHCKRRPYRFSASSLHLKLESLTSGIAGQGISGSMCVRCTAVGLHLWH